MRRVHAPKRKVNKKVTKKKAKTKRRRKLLYTCSRKQVTTRKIIFDEPNEHGAMNDVHKAVPVYEISFSVFSSPLRNVIPDVFEAQFYIATSDEEIYNKFQVGQEYDLAPKLG
jgi:hypothetical protein